MHSCFVIRYRFYYQWFFWKLNATETGKTCNKSIRWLFCLLFFFSFFLFLNFNEIPKYDGCNTGMLGLKDPTAVHMKFKDKRFKMSLVRRRSSGKCISKCSNIKGTLNLNYVFFPCRLWLSPFLSVVASRVGVWLVCMGRGGGAVRGIGRRMSFCMALCLPLDCGMAVVIQVLFVAGAAFQKWWFDGDCFFGTSNRIFYHFRCNITAWKRAAM